MVFSAPDFVDYPLADTHTHLYFSDFSTDQDDVVRKCRQRNVAFQLQIGCDEVSSVAAVDLAQKYPEFYASVGLHPTDVRTCFDPQKPYRPFGYEDYSLTATNFDQLFDFFDQVITRCPDKVIALGETGFDLYHENSEEIKKIQWECFRRHIFLAQKYDLPVIIHTRNARETLQDFLRTHKDISFRAIIHCFSEDENFAQEMTQEYGFMLGIGGVATYPKSHAIRQAIQKTDLSFLVTETDAPFLVPQRARKNGEKKNDASFIPEVVDLIADLKNQPREETGKKLYENAMRFFKLPELLRSGPSE